MHHGDAAAQRMLRSCFQRCPALCHAEGRDVICVQGREVQTI